VAACKNPVTNQEKGGNKAILPKKGRGGKTLINVGLNPTRPKGRPRFHLPKEKKKQKKRKKRRRRKAAFSETDL